MSSIALTQLSQVGPIPDLHSVSENHPIAEIRTPSRASHSIEDERSLSTQPIGEESPLSSWQTLLIIGSVTSVTILNSMLGGLLTVGLPTMAKQLDLPAHLLLWPPAVNALASGCTLLLSGSIADVVGPRYLYLVGNLFLGVFSLACGLAQTGIQLILFRAFQGVAMSLCLPASVSIITNSFPTGRRRNIAFSCMGSGQPIGFSIGLVLGGIFIDTIGWRYGYYIGSILTLVIFALAVFALPKDPVREPVTLHRLAVGVDWIGGTTLSLSLGLLSYIFSVLTGSSSAMTSPTNIAFLALALALLPLFVLHTHRQERLSRTALIPNTIWANPVFTSICLVVFIAWAVFNSFQYFLTLFFQEIQLLSPLQTSIRFLPMVVSGFATNIATGILVQRVKANKLVVVAAAVTCAAPLLMALVDPGKSYWTYAFTGTLLSPIGVDVLFTVSNLIITEAFPNATHGLAGAVFATISQIGNSVGLALAAVIASSVTMKVSRGESGASVTPGRLREDLMAGYRATFWTMTGLSVGVSVLAAWGLRRIGRVGLKRD